MKKVYAYDQNTGAFTYPIEVQESPLEPGKYLDDIPNTLSISPPETNNNEIACVVNGTWIVKSDYREQIFYKPDGSRVEITDIDILPELDWTVEPPVLPIPPKTQFTSLEYLDRFTEAEQLEVVSATLQSPQVKLWYDRLLAASYIDLNDPRTEYGIDALISAGLIDASRKPALMQVG